MKVESTKRIYEGRVINVRVDDVDTGHGKHTWEVVEHAEAVVVIPMPAPNEIVLCKQYRHPLGRDNWEVCAGGVEKGETPHDAAIRELSEETGFRAKMMRRLWSAYTAPGFCTELLHFFVTDDYEIGEPSPDADEEIELATFPITRLREMMERDELPDAKTQIAVLWALTARSMR